MGDGRVHTALVVEPPPLECYASYGPPKDTSVIVQVMPGPLFRGVKLNRAPPMQRAERVFTQPTTPRSAMQAGIVTRVVVCSDSLLATRGKPGSSRGDSSLRIVEVGLVSSQELVT